MITARVEVAIDTLIVSMLVCTLGGCETPFDARSQLQKDLIVYSVLSNDRQCQFIRIGQTFMTPVYDTQAVSFIANARVTVTDGLTSMTFRDTTLRETGPDGLPSLVRVYACVPFLARQGTKYQLQVEAEGFRPVQSAIQLPASPVFGLWPMTNEVLDNPSSYQNDEDILFPLKLGSETHGYVARLYVVYQLLENNRWREARIEVPTALRYGEWVDSLVSLKYGLYASMKPRPSNAVASGAYRNRLYQLVLIHVYESTPRTTALVFDRVVFELLQAETNLYSYYMTVHNFGDPQSTRLDDPIFSNISNGVGLFGGYSIDSVVHRLSASFAFNR
jgi:hypothetical protein